jgi:hypothetical protein
MNESGQTVRIEDDDAQREATVRRRADLIANLLDARFKLPGTSIRFGYDAIVGLIPGIGDTITSAVSLYLVVEAYRLRIGAWPITKMLFNVAIDWLVGLVPGLDVVLDVAFKANAKNAAILKKALDRRRSPREN